MTDIAKAVGAASEKHKDKFVETAREIATLTNTRLEVREFEVHKVLEVIEP